MFTGLVAAQGRVQALQQGSVLKVEVATPWTEPFVRGESIACNGICLTVIASQGSAFSVEIGPESLSKTTASQWRVGQVLHLEKALRPVDRLGGHFVQGHIDGLGRVLSSRPSGGAWNLRIGLEEAVGRWLVEKGSVAVDGVSLTVNALGRDWFEVSLIPETQVATHLAALRPGDSVNLEADLLGKYVDRLLAGRQGLPRAPSPSPR